MTRNNDSFTPELGSRADAPDDAGRSIAFLWRALGLVKPASQQSDTFSSREKVIMRRSGVEELIVFDAFPGRVAFAFRYFVDPQFSRSPPRPRVPKASHGQDHGP
jgi:hypothetical protein